MEEQGKVAKEEPKRYRDIDIHPVLNGFVVIIGCQIAVFNKAEDMLRELQLYYNDPRRVEEEYLKGGMRFREPVSGDYVGWIHDRLHPEPVALGNPANRIERTSGA